MKTGDIYSNNQPAVATIGFFDGVHLGHRHLIAQVMDEARLRGLRSMVITFATHPRQVLQAGYRQPLLSTPQDKLQLLSQTGVDHCLLLEFNQNMAALSAREFMALLRETCKVEVLLIGYNHRFGHNRAEGFDDYVEYGRQLGMQVVQASELPLTDGFAHSVSSSYIRQLLIEGNVESANACLGYPYVLQGRVVEGFRVGRSIGFPTANLELSCADKLVPLDGVYAVYVDIDSQRYKGMLNIGMRPTVGRGTTRSIEVHVLGFAGNLYGRELRLSLMQRTRGEVKFNSVDALAAQLRLDAQQIDGLLS